MDQTSAKIVDFVDGFEPGALGDRVVHEAKRRLVDSLACAIAAIGSPPATIARGLAPRTTSWPSATMIGSPESTTAEMAAFANTAMVRYLDYNDMLFTARGGGGHPSDLIPTALAIGEAVGASGLDVVGAIVLGYELNGALASAVWIRERGWDQGLNIVAATAMMAGKLLGLSRAELGHALALAVTPNVPVRQTRIGHLSMWKGCATAGAARNGIFAGLLAGAGMTGPPSPYEGSSGVWEQVTGPFELELPVGHDAYVIERVATKTRPAEYNAQGPIDLMLELRDLVDVDDIGAIELETYHLAYHEIGGDAAKWDPQTRETADHSLPYLLAVALVDGRIDTESCAEARVSDPGLRPLMHKIRITENPQFTERFPQEISAKLTIRLGSGEEIVRQTPYPRGHHLNPLTDDEINAKYDGIALGMSRADDEICEALRDSLWHVHEVKDIGELMVPLGLLGTGNAGEPHSRHDG